MSPFVLAALFAFLAFRLNQIAIVSAGLAILAGFLAAYVFLFILPIFLDESQRMMFFRYIPTLPQRGIIGEDAKSIQLFVL